MAAPGDSLEEFAAAVRAFVEREAVEHADDLWWILEPTLLTQDRELAIRATELGPELATTSTGRALAHASEAELSRALGVRRCAVVLHVDLLLDGEIRPAIVFGVFGALASAYQYAAVDRTDAGLPRLGPWQPGAELAGELAGALRRTLGVG